MAAETRSPDAWILTYTGRRFWPLEPRAEDVFIEDIAHALSCICRFTGHVREFYSVAQHCFEASLAVPLEHALGALLHDASEAYLCDIARPVKNSPTMQGYRDAEAVLERVIAERFNVVTYSPEIKDVDDRLLVTEARDLMPKNAHWKFDQSRAYPTAIDDLWTPKQAEELFLIRFRHLTTEVR